MSSEGGLGCWQSGLNPGSLSPPRPPLLQRGLAARLSLAGKEAVQLRLTLAKWHSSAREGPDPPPQLLLHPGTPVYSCNPEALA